jgi:hypothetical protein
MSRRAASFTQADVARVIRAAKKEGASSVVVKTGETSIVVRLEPSDKNNVTESEEEIIL